MSLGTLTLTLQANTSPFDRKLTKSKANVHSLGDAMESVVKRSKRFNTAFRDMEKGGGSPFNNTLRNMQKLKSVSGQVAGIWKKMALGATAFATATSAAFAAFTASSVKSFAQFESTLTSFETLLGSRGRARALVSDLQEFSKLTPFTPEDTFGAARRLLSGGFEDSGILNNLKMIGDVAAGTNSRIADLAMIFAEVNSKGKADAADLLQFGRRGIPIAAALQKTLGVSGSELRKLVSSGKVGIDELIEGFKGLTKEGGMFFEAAAAQSKTLSGRWSTLVGNFNAGKVAFGQAFADSSSLGDALVMMNETIKDMDWEAMGRIASDTFKTIAGSASFAMSAVVGFNEALLLGQKTVLDSMALANKVATLMPGSDLARFLGGTGNEAQIRDSIAGERAKIEDRQADLRTVAQSAKDLFDNISKLGRKPRALEPQGPFPPEVMGPFDPDALGVRRRITPRQNRSGSLGRALSSALRPTAGAALGFAESAGFVGQEKLGQQIRAGDDKVTRSINNQTRQLSEALMSVQRAIMQLKGATSQQVRAPVEPAADI